MSQKDSKKALLRSTFRIDKSRVCSYSPHLWNGNKEGVRKRSSLQRENDNRKPFHFRVKLNNSWASESTVEECSFARVLLFFYATAKVNEFLIDTALSKHSNDVSHVQI
jgi:hypothetical protein